jgi:hypothetical protein
MAKTKQRAQKHGAKYNMYNHGASRHTDKTKQNDKHRAK